MTDLGMRIDHQLDGFAGEFVGHFEVPALVGHGAVLADLAGHPMVEQRVQLGGLVARADGSSASPADTAPAAFARQAAMRAAVIDLLEPGPKPGVEILQIP